MKNYPNIARVLKDARLKTGFTQGDLSKVLGFKNAQFVSNVERAICSLPPYKAYLTSEFLNSDPKELRQAAIDDFIYKYDNAVKKGRVKAEEKRLIRETLNRVQEFF